MNAFMLVSRHQNKYNPLHIERCFRALKHPRYHQYDVDFELMINNTSLEYNFFKILTVQKNVVVINFLQINKFY